MGVFGGGEERGVVRSMQIGHSFNNIRCLRKCLYRWEYSFLNVDKRRIFAMYQIGLLKIFKRIDSYENWNTYITVV